MKNAGFNVIDTVFKYLEHAYNMLNLTLLTLVGCYIITLIKPFTVSSGLAVDWKMVIILATIR